MALRRSVQDFMAQVNAQTPGSVSKAVYSTALNSDGSVKITSTNPTTGVATVVYASVWWNTSVYGAATDLNPGGDRVTILQNDKSIATADAQQFINSLT